MTTLHATCIAIGRRGVLLTGASGAGKSDLALRLIDRGAQLVSDDGVVVGLHDGRLIASAPATIANKLEVRGVGIVAMEAAPSAHVALVVALDQQPNRMPDDPLPRRTIEGIAVPVIALAPFEASTPVKVEQALLLYGLTS